MDLVAEAEARAGGYILLAELVARGPEVELRDAIEASPLLKGALGSYDEAEDAAVDHQHAFGFCLPLLEGAFLDPEGRASGLAAERVRASYQAFGYKPDPRAEPAEHLASELRALGVLSGAEADALSQQADDVAAGCRAHARELLDEHVLRWVPELQTAVVRLERLWPEALIAQVLELALLDRERLGGEVAAWSLEGDVLDLDDERTDLRAIAAYLTTASRAGVFLSKEDIARLARQVEVPRGFGGRALEMQNLLRAASRFDALPAVIDGLRGILNRYQTRTMNPSLSAWHTRSLQSAELLERVRNAEWQAEP